MPAPIGPRPSLTAAPAQPLHAAERASETRQKVTSGPDVPGPAGPPGDTYSARSSQPPGTRPKSVMVGSAPPSIDRPKRQKVDAEPQGSSGLTSNQVAATNSHKPAAGPSAESIPIGLRQGSSSGAIGDATSNTGIIGNGSGSASGASSTPIGDGTSNTIDVTDGSSAGGATDGSVSASSGISGLNRPIASQAYAASLLPSTTSKTTRRPCTSLRSHSTRCAVSLRGGDASRSTARESASRRRTKFVFASGFPGIPSWPET